MLFDEIKNNEGRSNSSLKFCRAIDLVMILLSKVTKF